MFTHNCLLLIFFQKKKKKHFPHVFQSVVIICILIVIHVCCPRERLEKTRGLEKKKIILGEEEKIPKGENFVGRGWV